MENRKWITDEEYKEGLALAQLVPGPLAAQLGIYLGFVHYRIRGATLAGLAFILPSFVMVVGLGMAYKLFGGLPWMKAIFYGVGAVVIGIIAMSAFKLTIKSVSNLNRKAIQSHWLLWIFYLIGMVVTVWTQSKQVLLFVLAGMVYLVVKAPPRWLGLAKSPVCLFAFAGAGLWNYQPGMLSKIGLFFLKRVHCLRKWLGNRSLPAWRRGK